MQCLQPQCLQDSKKLKLSRNLSGLLHITSRVGNVRIWDVTSCYYYSCYKSLDIISEFHSGDLGLSPPPSRRSKKWSSPHLSRSSIYSRGWMGVGRRIHAHCTSLGIKISRVWTMKYLLLRDGQNFPQPVRSRYRCLRPLQMSAADLISKGRPVSNGSADGRLKRYCCEKKGCDNTFCIENGQRLLLA